LRGIYERRLHRRIDSTTTVAEDGGVEGGEVDAGMFRWVETGWILVSMLGRVVAILEMEMKVL
jgi:hypothetical protein